jgi:predicted aspartyl protease
VTPHTTSTLIACAFTSILFATTALADDCRLGRVATADFTENGLIIVPVTLDGTREPMALDTGAPLSAVDPVVAKNLGLIEKRMFQAVYNANGEVVTYLAVVHNLGIGDMHGNDVKMIVWPSPMTKDGRIAGTLGADLLRNYDIDIDFGARRLSLFSQEHCPGRVVYWTNDNVAVVPIHVVNSGHIVLPVKLDGHDVDAILDLGSSRSQVSMEFAHDLFGLESNSPGMEQVGAVSGSVQTAVYRHTFKSLSVEGLTINNPTFYIWDNLVKYSATQAPPTGSRLNDLRESEGHTDVTLGLAELNQLHVYIAYKEQKLYMSAASAPVTVASSAAPAAPASSAPAATPSAPAAPH